MSFRENDPTPVWRTLRFRLLGLLPLAFFIARVIEYVQMGTPSQVLWMCHLANLMLAAGLFLASPLLIRIAVLFVVFGVPPWAIDMWVIQIVTPVSVFSHLGGAIVGLYVISKLRMRTWVWAPATVCFIVVQFVCRFVTPPALNVNTAHRVYDIWKDTFSAYWQYWLVSMVVVAVSLWVIEFCLVRFFPFQMKPALDNSA